MALVLENMREEVYDRILEKIMKGVYPAGTRLVNRKLATELGVSITPVREALNNLAQEGIIKLVPHLGFFVKDFNMMEMAKVYQVRECIEPFVARLAAENVNDIDIEELRNINARLKEAAERQDWENVIHQEQEFHNYIAELSGNEYMANIIMNCRIMELCSRFAATAIAKMSGSELEEFLLLAKKAKTHGKIIDALAKHDGQEAARIMRSHFTYTIPHILKYIGNNNSSNRNSNLKGR